jgi:hypothetical protein
VRGRQTCARRHVGALFEQHQQRRKPNRVGICLFDLALVCVVSLTSRRVVDRILYAIPRLSRLYATYISDVMSPSCLLDGLDSGRDDALPKL